MIREFTSNDQDFLARANKKYAELTFVVLVCGFSMVALVYALIYHEGKGSWSRVGRVLDGVSNMSTTSILITIISCVLILIGSLVFWYTYFKNREIVVGLKFNDISKELTVNTKTIGGQEYERVHKYAELSWEDNHLSDGMTPPMYNTLTLVKGNYLAGHLYVDHFTWEGEILSEIKMKLKVVCECSAT